MRAHFYGLFLVSVLRPLSGTLATALVSAGLVAHLLQPEAARATPLPNEDLYPATFADAVLGGVPNPYFPDPFADRTFSAIGDASQLATADFDGDGHLDVAFPSSFTFIDGNQAYPATLTVLLGAGDGTFPTMVLSASSSGGTTARAGDFDEDGNLDILSGGLAVALLLGDGAGGFNRIYPVPGTPAINATENHFSDVVPADFDQDGHLDMAYLRTNDHWGDGSASLGILYGKGDGTFEDHRVVHVFDEGAVSLAAADLGGGAGPVDLFVIGETVTPPGPVGTEFPSRLLYFQGTGNRFSANPAIADFTLSQTVLLSEHAIDVETGDFDGDSDLDVAVVAGFVPYMAAYYSSVPTLASGTLNIYFGNGSALGSRVDVSTNDLSRFGRSIDVADLDADGFDDILIGNWATNSIDLFYGAGDRSFVSGSAPTGGEPWAITTGDFDADGSVDLVAHGSAPDRVTVLRTLGQRFDGRPQQISDLRTTFTAVPADVNRDYLPEILADHLRFGIDPIASRILATRSASGAYDSVDASGVPLNLADLDGDGALDAFDKEEVRLGNGDGTFQPAVPLPLGSAGESSEEIRAGDVNGDGLSDVVIVRPSVPEVGVLISKRNLDFEERVNYAAGPEPGSSCAISLYDLTLDGHLDVVVSCDNYLTTFVGRGDGTFRSASTIVRSLGNTGYVGPPGAGDLTGDGIPDLISPAGDSHVLHVGVGDGSFGSGTQVPLLDMGLSETEEYRRFHSVDFDRDGNDDLSFVVDPGLGYYNGLSPDVRYLLRGLGDGNFEAVAGIYIGTANGDAGPPFDVDGDQDLDVLNAGPRGTQIYPSRQSDLDALGGVIHSLGMAAAPVRVIDGQDDYNRAALVIRNVGCGSSDAPEAACTTGVGDAYHARMLEGAVVNGPITVRDDTSLIIEGGAFEGPLNARDSAVIYVRGYDFTGPGLTPEGGIPFGNVGDVSGILASGEPFETSFSLGFGPFGIEGSIVFQSSALYVDDTAVGANDGSSWADAFVELQSALAVAAPGDTVLVAEGIYTPDFDTVAQTHTADRNASFELLDDVTLRGGYPNGGGPRAPSAHPSQLSGDIAFANSFHVVNASGSDSTAVLDGFTVTAGLADGAFPVDRGAGLYNAGGAATIRNVRFVGNQAAGFGAGVSNDDGALSLLDVVFIGNAITGPTGEGGALFNNGASKLRVERARFYGNSAFRGGAFSNFPGAAAVVQDSIFSGNSASDIGGAVLNFQGTLEMDGTTMTANSAGAGGGFYLFDPVTLRNGIFWGNTGGQISGASATVSGAIVQGGYPGGANVLDADPLFRDATGVDGTPGSEDDDLRLAAASPAHGASGPDPCTAADLSGVIRGAPCDLGAHEYRNAPGDFWTNHELDSIVRAKSHNAAVVPVFGDFEPSADDFVVPAGMQCTVSEVRAVLEDGTDTQNASLRVHDDSNDHPGSVLTSASNAAVACAHDDSISCSDDSACLSSMACDHDASCPILDGAVATCEPAPIGAGRFCQYACLPAGQALGNGELGRVFEHSFPGLSLELGPGRYWISAYGVSEASGVGTAYWRSAGNGSVQGSSYQHLPHLGSWSDGASHFGTPPADLAMEVDAECVPEPDAPMMLVSGALLLAALRRRQAGRVT